MATRLYPTLRVLDAQFFTPVRGAFGESTIGDRLHGLVNFNFLLTTDKALGGTIGTGGTSLVSGAGPWTDRDVLLLRAVTKPLDAQIMAGQTLDFCLGGVPHAQPGATPPDTIQWVVYAWSARYNAATDTWDPVATLISTTINPTAFTDDGTPRFFGPDAPIALDAGAGQINSGDRIVVEIGQRLNVPHTPLEYGSETTTLRVYHGTSGALTADGVINSTLVTTRCGWIEFSGALTELADPAAPANDACADAEVIAALPYASSVFHAGMSTDTGNSVWYTWTADESIPVFVSLYGSYSYAVGAVIVYTGGCGALAGVASASDTVWVQQTHLLVRWNAVAGTQYWIRVQLGSASLRAGACAVQVWKQQPVADGDLFVDCQHIVALRAGQLIKGTPSFFNSTPTGNAIDYTLKELTNLNGGTHASLRLAVVLFAFELVELIDLETLNYGQFEVNYHDFSPPLSDAEQGASVLYDRTGDLYVGLFGDNYDEIGQLPTVPASGWPVKLNGQTANPSTNVAALAVYQVAFDVQASDYIEVSSDNATLFYTSAGTHVKRFDLAGAVQLPDFATVPNAAGPRPGLRSGRLLPPGDGSGGMLVCNGSEIVRLNSSGTVIQTYTPSDSQRGQDLDKVECDPLVAGAVETFWVSDQLAATLYRFNLATGAELAKHVLNLATGQLCGFTIYNGYRAGIGEAPTPSSELPTPCPVINPEPATGPVCTAPVFGPGS